MVISRRVKSFCRVGGCVGEYKDLVTMLCRMRWVLILTAHQVRRTKKIAYLRSVKSLQAVVLLIVFRVRCGLFSQWTTLNSKVRR